MAAIINQAQVKFMFRASIRTAKLLVAITITTSAGAQASTTLYAIGGGWFSNTGEHLEFNTNYVVGGGADGFTRRNYFLFDLSGTNGPFASATLRVYNPSAPASPGFPFGYTSADPTETYALFDVSTPFFSYVLPGGNRVAGYTTGSLPGQRIFDDLGTGRGLGSSSVSLADNGHYIEINMNSTGLAALNASEGFICYGGCGYHTG